MVTEPRKTKSGWKVLRRVSGRLVSALAGSRWRGGSYNRLGSRTQYYLEKWVTPGTGHTVLTCFAKKEDAIVFASVYAQESRQGLEVWPCHFVPAGCAPVWAHWLSLPRGTKFAERIKLRKYGTVIHVSVRGG